jgi:hypothetical protein
MARIWGLGQTYPRYEHPFFAESHPLLIVKTDTLKKAQEAVSLRPDIILWLDVRFSRERTPFILPASRDKEFLNNKQKEQEKSPSVPIMTGSRLSEYPWEQINEFFHSAPALKEFYELFPKTRFVLNIVDNINEAHTTVVESLKDHKPNNRTLIQSDTLIIMTAIKELKPEWVYGTSIPDIMRLMTFDSMLILPSIQFRGDIFVAPFTVMKRPAFNDNIIAEMRRRNKRLFLGPISTKEELVEAGRLKSDGYITENLPELLRLLGQGPAQ